MALSNYAESLNHLEQHEQAEQLLKRVLDARRKVLGPNKLYTLLSLSSYGTTLAMLHRDDEALPILKEAFELKRKNLGLKNKYTLFTLSDYALTLGRLGRVEEAEPLLKKSLQLRAQVFGPEHEYTIKALNDYAAIRIRETNDDVELLKTALGLTRQVLGPAHPTTLAALNNYAFALMRSGRLSEAAPWFQLVATLRLQVNGPEDPTTLRALNTYASALRRLGRLNKDLMSVAIDVDQLRPKDEEVNAGEQIWEKYGWNEMDSSWKMFSGWKGNVKEILEGLKVVELKEQCRAAGLKVGGTKAELVARLKEHAASVSSTFQAESKEEAKQKDPETITEQIWKDKGWNEFSGSWTFGDFIGSLFKTANAGERSTLDAAAKGFQGTAVEKIWREKHEIMNMVRQELEGGSDSGGVRLG
jgi:hypothetical protein